MTEQLNNAAISVRNLSKSYRMYPSPKEKLKELLHPFGKKYHKEFWALSDVSFEVKKGECIGIIGRNGSGKSTLLQIICGVLQPNAGETKVNGRISALLELGAGFNKDFTGRENVYMNGALMGFAKEDMDARFQAIADFADIGDFIEQPVKTYSSGMYVRLAFACAVNVDPDILIVDEALSVGDEAFQRKCFSRIMNFQKQGKTILFVSHSAGVIVELCDRAMLFDQGERLISGVPKEIVSKYHKLVYAPPEKLSSMRAELKRTIEDHAAGHPAGESGQQLAAGNKDGPYVSLQQPMYDPHLKPKSAVTYESRGAVISDPFITTVKSERVNVLVRGEEYIYSYSVNFDNDAYRVRFGMLIKTVSGFELGGLVSHTQANPIEYIEKGTILNLKFRFRCSLMPGVYFLNSGLMGTIDGSEVFLHRIVDIAMFRVQAEPDLLAHGVIDFSASSSSFQGADVKSEVIYVKRGVK